MTAGADSIEHRRVQALGRAVDSGGQPRWPCADDGQIGRLVAPRPIAKPKVLGKLAGSRADQRARVRQDHRQIADAQRGCAHERATLDRIGVEPHVRQVPSRGIRAKRQCPRVQVAADDLQPLGGWPSPKPLPPGEELLQQQVGQLGVLSHEAAQLGGRDPMHPPGLDHARPQERGLAGEQTEFTHVGARTKADHGGLGGARGRLPGQLDRAILNQDQVVAGIAGLEKGVADFEVLGIAVGAQTAELCFGQGWGSGFPHRG